VTLALQQLLLSRKWLQQQPTLTRENQKYLQFEQYTGSKRSSTNAAMQFDINNIAAQWW